MKIESLVADSISSIVGFPIGAENTVFLVIFDMSFDQGGALL